MIKPIDIDEYIAGFPEETQKVLVQLRLTIKETVPQADEVISYGMPAFKLDGILVWFAAYTNHIGIYPRTSAIEAFKEELAIYKCSKGAIQLPLNKPLPLDLIIKIVKFRAEDNLRQGINKRN